jgi:hypothetical protein
MAGCAALLLLGAGCSGSIDGSPGGAIDPFRPGAIGTGGSSSVPVGPNDPGAGPGGNQDPGSKDPSQPGAAGVDPGSVTLHRLNRAEYANTVRDLLGTTQRPSDQFPPDDRGYGYDNIADVLSLSPVQLEMYFNAAEALVDEAMATTQVGPRRYEAEMMTASTGAAFQTTAWTLGSPGNLSQVVAITTAGEYRLRVRAWERAAGTEAAHAIVAVDGMTLETFSVNATQSTPGTYETTAMLAAGNRQITIAFDNDHYVPENMEDRNLYVDFLEVDGPVGVSTAGNPLRARIMSCEPSASDPKPCWTEVARDFGARAWRKPLGSEDVSGLVALAEAARSAGDDVETATRLMLRAVLIAPRFLFRVEIDADPASPAPHALDDYELASRLSYFLWSSMPDATLLELAAAGTLHEDATLRAQVARMLADEKARALVDNFAGQWLFTRALDDHQPDYQAFPEFDDALRAAMRTETELYFREFLFGDATMDQFLTADFGFVDDRLARHYGLPAPGGDFERVSLAGSERTGLLTQAGVLMVTSYPTRTSPVKRGKWVLEQLLCSSPPPPPADIPALVVEDTPTGSLRQRMEEHRSNPVCASCHTLMDPIGFGFEHFDGIGKYREDDHGFEIDPAGMLPDGSTFQSPAELARLLAADERLPRCMTQQLLTYALGRGAEPFDDDDIASVSSAFVVGGYRLPQLVELIVTSDAFRRRRGEEVAP